MNKNYVRMDKFTWKPGDLQLVTPAPAENKPKPATDEPKASNHVENGGKK